MTIKFRCVYIHEKKMYFIQIKKLFSWRYLEIRDEDGECYKRVKYKEEMGCINHLRKNFPNRKFIKYGTIIIF